jgi:hypothetical protein
MAWKRYLLTVPFPYGFCCFCIRVWLVWCHVKALGTKLIYINVFSVCKLVDIDILMV